MIGFRAQRRIADHSCPVIWNAPSPIINADKARRLVLEERQEVATLELAAYVPVHPIMSIRLP
jgi:hypothetical protein